jgi:hypothetical protein
MSKSMTATPSTPVKPSQPAMAAPQASAMTQVMVPQEKIAMRAYEKWLKCGCKNGEDKKHWFEAEAELKAEMMKTARPK